MMQYSSSIFHNNERCERGDRYHCYGRPKQVQAVSRPTCAGAARRAPLVDVEQLAEDAWDMLSMWAPGPRGYEEHLADE